LDRAIFPALPATLDGPAEGSAYWQVACGLRQAIAGGRYPARQRLLTQAELVSDTGLSHQTVRRAFQKLVTDGTTYRARRRGTFAVQRPLEVPRMAFGRVCLIGDAAFAVRPHAAAGTAKAADDGWALADELTAFAGDVPAALAAWKRRQLKVGPALLARTREIGDSSQFNRQLPPR
jgi:2-polyprenyl-6-methoxyphenol hydroxylase-like FAD-dependent oxidoreductase